MAYPTARLLLVPLSPTQLLALIEGQSQFAQAFGYPAGEGFRDFFVSGDVSPSWLDLLRSSSSADPWMFGFALVHQAYQQVIGSASFKGPPNGSGSVEIAYGVIPSFQGQGYATEAAQELVAFAFRDRRVSAILAHTLPTRNASTRVLEKCGFVFVGEVIDPEDGRVWRWQRRVASV